MLAGYRLMSFIPGLLINVVVVSTCLFTPVGPETAAGQDQSADQAAPQDPDPRVGQKVIVTVAGAMLRTPDSVVWKAYLGETFTVALTNGEWLWINEKGGWLWEQQTVPYDTAVQELTKKIQESATSENYHLRGIAYGSHREYDKAIADFTQSLKLQDNVAGVLNNRGQAYYLKGDYEAAIHDLDAAVKADPKHFVAMNNRALCHIARRALDKALIDLNAAIALNAEYPEALNNRAVVYSQQGDYHAAIKDLTQALTVYENYIDAYGNRSFAYRKLGQFPEAIADLKTAMQKNPLDYKPVNDYAWILATTAEASVRNPDQAILEATRACEMTQYANWNALDTLAASYAAKGDFKTALQWITTAIEKAPLQNKPTLQQHQQLIAEQKPIQQ